MFTLDRIIKVIIMIIIYKKLGEEIVRLTIVAKKINSNAVNGAYDAFNTGDNTLRIYIYYSSTNVINNATLYRILKPAYTKEFDPIMSGATLRSTITSSYITEDDHGTWGGDITVHSNYIISGSNKYYIPIFVNSTEYVTSAT